MTFIESGNLRRAMGQRHTSAPDRLPSFRSIAFVRLLVVLTLFGSDAWAATVTKVVFASGSASGCTQPPEVSSFRVTDPHARLWFTVSNANAGDVASVQWHNPNDQAFSNYTWRPLSGGGGWCFNAILNISGTGAANMPGLWTARILWNNIELARRSFQILSAGGGSGASPRVTNVDRPYYLPGAFTLIVSGAGFQRGATAHIDYTQPPARRLTINGPVSTVFVSDRQINVPVTVSGAGPYTITVQNPTGTTAPAFPFYVAFSGFHLPFASGETWRLSQGNRDTPTHLTATVDSFAYDFADMNRCVVAMKAGMAYPHDNNTTQGSSLDYGNWVTIDHGGGEYSHYAHLLRGRLAFSTPTWVQQGQALGIVGNSGRTEPTGGGYHVHVKVTGPTGTAMNRRIYDQAVPFAFAPNYDATMVGPVPGQTAPTNSSAWVPYTSSNFSVLGTCPSSAAPERANFNITFSPNPVGAGFGQGCPATTYYFHLMAAETNGIGINLSSLSVEGAGTWTLPALGVPRRIEAKGTFQTGLSWCRSPGSSRFTIVGTDDRGVGGVWSGNINFR